MRSQVARKNLSATEIRNLRTLLLVSVFDREAIGKRIKQAREEAVLSGDGVVLRQEDLADLVGVSTRTIQNYEAGTTSPFGKLKQIAAILGPTVEWFLYGDPAVSEPSDLAGQGVALVLDRLEAIEGIVAAQAEETATGFRALTEGIARLERQQPPGDQPEQKPV